MKSRSFWIGLLILLGLLVGAWVALTLVFQWFGSLDENLAAALITALLGLIGLWYTQWESKTRDISENHREKKIEVYNNFFDLVERFQNNAIPASALDGGDVSEQLKAEFRRLTRGLLIWGSPAVIRAYLKFRVVSAEGGNILLAVDEMYRAMRKDLGNSNFGLQNGDLIRLNLKDPNELKP
ncbi:MAG: hypothetical protein Q7T36_15640 [Fluviicoccus sp.]|uniref:hypothetical protein n=1 Tax=Fluviicoccus sp. TaxID=2003552 RepID=UPI002722F74F|nr:hypothetical protein [Fluviicoccus sp.]MDO8331897.1 hypothetical protein [Fluviicoccus sp.]